MSQRVVPLETLIFLRAEHLRKRAEAVRQCGEGSWNAEWERATVARLEELIAEAPQNEAIQNLEDAINNGPINRSHVKECIKNVLEADAGQRGRDAVRAAVTKVLKSDQDALEQLLKRAKPRNSNVTEKEIRDAIIITFEDERDDQLLGRADDDPNNGRTMALVNEALDISQGRRMEKLEELVHDANQPGASVSDEQLSEAVGGVMANERQIQLLGGSTENAMKLVSDALDVSYRNRKNVLRTLLQKVKNPANRVSRQEIRTAVTAMLSSEKQRQLLGTSDAPDPDLAELLNEVARLERQGGKVSIKMGELRLKYGPAE